MFSLFQKFISWLNISSNKFPRHPIRDNVMSCIIMPIKQYEKSELEFYIFEVKLRWAVCYVAHRFSELINPRISTNYKFVNFSNRAGLLAQTLFQTKSAFVLFNGAHCRYFKFFPFSHSYEQAL